MAGIGTNIGWNQVNKKVTKTTRKAIKVANELVVPKSASDAAMYAIPYGRAAKITKRAVGGITKAGAKYVGKVYRNIG
jgi:hypothetical protein